eukprot:CAMPEP_0118913750 /NCGR_PEP_ID=MMETSP1166-20130328/14419_1 /TAXON_ID=1104430 /ORGANISM="Chrysoreinhardia sp, Strain CCMP3193" /LENGTH=546 /DNA_ID=CAMNT_0006853315 /DNA_START=151 /DNA_END=1794 /DNA_ORIENTATION=+
MFEIFSRGSDDPLMQHPSYLPSGVGLFGEATVAGPLDVSSALSAQAHQLTQSSAARRQKLYKTQMCRHVLATGSCAHGQYCHFAHDESELRPVGPEGLFGSSNSLVLPDTASNSSNTASNNWADPVAFAHYAQLRYKTRMCRHMARSGRCPRGDTCCFAHSEAELRKAPDDDSSSQGFAGSSFRTTTTTTTTAEGTTTAAARTSFPRERRRRAGSRSSPPAAAAAAAGGSTAPLLAAAGVAGEDEPAASSAVHVQDAPLPLRRGERAGAVPPGGRLHLRPLGGGAQAAAAATTTAERQGRLGLHRALEGRDLRGPEEPDAPHRPARRPHPAVPRAADPVAPRGAAAGDDAFVADPPDGDEEGSTYLMQSAFETGVFDDAVVGPEDDFLPCVVPSAVGASSPPSATDGVAPPRESSQVRYLCLEIECCFAEELRRCADANAQRRNWVLMAKYLASAFDLIIALLRGIEPWHLVLVHGDLPLPDFHDRTQLAAVLNVLAIVRDQTQSARDEAISMCEGVVEDPRQRQDDADARRAVEALADLRQLSFE